MAVWATTADRSASGAVPAYRRTISIRDRSRLLSLVIVSCTFFGWTMGSTAQERSPPNQPPVDAAQGSAPSSDSRREFLDYLRRMNRRLDRLSKQNADLTRENKMLAEQFDDLSRQSRFPSFQSDLTRDPFIADFSGFSNLSGRDRGR